jgi:alanyl-tRNA synthetase
MQKMTLTDTRNSFIDFFKKNNHKHLPSSALIPLNDPSLLFVNAGMVQFKDIFTQKQNAQYKNVVTCQKCVRAGGKHNDLENVGYTTRHHTFFEMLGNFSFGDYFKEQAILYCWEFLTKELQIAKDKLYITVHDQDIEAYNLWKKISNFDDSKLIKTNENFWSMADTGPCGPCSEVFFDNGTHLQGGLPGMPDGDRFIEVWNMVFMEFEQRANGIKVPLSIKSIDTGMGLERINAVLNKVCDNYDIPLFKELMESISDSTKTKLTMANKPSFKIITDHIRAICFLIADGVAPSNEGAGYVLRKITRRALLHAHLLNPKEGALNNVAKTLINLMSNPYEELVAHGSLIDSIITTEEGKFNSTIATGLHMLNFEIESISGNNIKTLEGSTAFKLHDTYGFPIVATIDLAKQHNILVDIEEFAKCMDQQKERSRQSHKEHTKSVIASKNSLEDTIRNLPPTNFIGYNSTSDYAKIEYILIDAQPITEIDNTYKEKFIIITDKTPFYPEAGGQIGDVGFISQNSGKARILDTQKTSTNVIIHAAIMEEGKICINEPLFMNVDEKIREQITNHHSATHILHSVLKKHLGEQIHQKGSNVNSAKLRLDFNYDNKLTNEILEKIEVEVNDIIKKRIDLEFKILNIANAKKEGALSLKGEKYDEEVRVVSIIDENNVVYSKELCCGTHVENTSQIGLFKIISEKSISSGIRRIEATTGFGALKIYENQIHDLTNKISELLEQNKSIAEQYKGLKLKFIQLTLQEANALAIKTKFGNIVFKYCDDANLDIKDLALGASKAVCLNGIDIAVFLTENKSEGIISISTSKQSEFPGGAKKILENLQSNIDAKGGGNYNLAQARISLSQFNQKQIKEAILKSLNQ